MSAMYCTEREPRGGWPRVTLFRVDNTCRKGRTGPSVRTALRQAPAEPGYWPTKKRSGVWFTRRYSFFSSNPAEPSPTPAPYAAPMHSGVPRVLLKCEERSAQLVGSSPPSFPRAPLVAGGAPCCNNWVRGWFADWAGFDAATATYRTGIGESRQRSRYSFGTPPQKKRSM